MTQTRRILSLFLPSLASDRIHRLTRNGAAREERAPTRPLATLAKIKGAQRLVAVDAAAARLGLRAGMSLADARAMHPGLDVAQADAGAEAALLLSIADWCRRFTPLAGLDAPDGALLDISGAAHLFGGEAALIGEIESRLAAQGFCARAAIAATPEAAWALARFSAARIAPADADEKALRRLFHDLPLAALRLEADVIDRLAQAGLRRIGDVALRPRAPIAARFGVEIFVRLDGLNGLTHSAISPRFETPAYVAERRFASAICSLESVEATIGALAQELAILLERHGEGARRLCVTLFRLDGAVRDVFVGASRPLRDPKALARLFRERLQSADEEGLEADAGFETVRLAALEVERMTAAQPALGALAGEETRHEAEDLAHLIDRLGARLGLRRVMRLVEQDTHIPEFADVAVAAAGSFARAPFSRPAGEGGPPKRECAKEGRMRAVQDGSHSMRNVVFLSAPPSSVTLRAPPSPAEREKGSRPIRLLERPERIETIASIPDGPPLRFRWRRVLHDVRAIEGPERIAPEWWRQESAALTRDYFRAEDAHGQRFWLFREGLYERETSEPRWYVHGLFA